MHINKYITYLYHHISNKLLYYCRNCGNEDDQLTTENICVSKVQLKRSEQKYNHIINEYTKLDPTLPRINTIKCPNSECSSNKAGGTREVIYLRYDDVDMLYIYLCAKCDTVWKTQKNN